MHIFEPEPNETSTIPKPEPIIPHEPMHSFEPQIEPTTQIHEKKTSFIPFDTDTQEAKPKQFTPISESKTSEPYKPKAVPFSSKTPIPTEIPEVFKVESTPELSQEKKSPLFEAASKEKAFDAHLETQKKTPSQAPFIQSSYTTSTTDTFSQIPSSSEKVSKKEKKRLEKEKKRLAKEEAKKQKEMKLEEERRKHDEMIETMRSLKKEDDEETSPISETPVLFQNISKPKEEVSKTGLFETLTKKQESETPKADNFILSLSKEQQFEEKPPSSLRIIPAVDEPQTDFAPKDNHFVEDADQVPSTVVCGNCGAVLSTIYKFCNKCGSKI